LKSLQCDPGVAFIPPTWPLVAAGPEMVHVSVHIDFAAEARAKAPRHHWLRARISEGPSAPERLKRPEVCLQAFLLPFVSGSRRRAICQGSLRCVNVRAGLSGR